MFNFKKKIIDKEEEEWIIKEFERWEKIKRGELDEDDKEEDEDDEELARNPGKTLTPSGKPTTPGKAKSPSGKASPNRNSKSPNFNTLVPKGSETSFKQKSPLSQTL